jgi:hypothetical protein
MDATRILRMTLKLNLKGTRHIRHFRTKCTAWYWKTQRIEETPAKKMKIWQGRRD